MTTWSRITVFALTALSALVATAAAFAHAHVSPPVVLAKAGQVFTLAVPTEKEGATTTTIELTPPSGFSIDSFVPAPGWKRTVLKTGSGDSAVVTKVTWSGGAVPTDEDAAFSFLGETSSSGSYTFAVRQTYSDGSVVDWSGPESSDTPAPVVEARSSRSPSTCCSQPRSLHCARSGRSGRSFPYCAWSAFGRGYLDLELVLGLFGLAAAAALWLDRPQQAKRSIAALLAFWGTLLAAGAALFAPGIAGHASQTQPRALALALDALHLGAAAIWVGGLVGLLVLWRSLAVAQRVAGLLVCVPRFSNVAFVSVFTLLGSGIWASVLHLPTLASLWETSYGKTIVLKSLLLLAAMLVAAVHLLRTKPSLRMSVERPDVGPGAAVLLRRLVGGEVVLVSGAVLAAALLSSLPPPPRALADLGTPIAHTGPGPVTAVVNRDGYRLELHVTPNRAAVQNAFAVRIERGGAPVRGADVVATFTMLDMEEPTESYRLAEAGPGLYEHAAPALVM